MGRIYELSQKTGRLTPMEGLRGLAVLVVFFVHFDALFGEYALGVPGLSRAFRFLGIAGNTGVDVFFVLSGYLIYGAVIRNTTGLPHFLRRRVERIYPTFLAVFAFYTVLSILLPEHSRLHGLKPVQGVTYILENLLLLPGIFDIRPLITVAWSLSYEFFFYLSLPILVRAIGMGRWRPAMRTVFFVSLWCAYFAFCFAFPKSHVRMLMFVTGILLYESLSSHAFRRLLTRQGEALTLALLLGSMGYVYVLEFHRNLFSGLPGWEAGRDLAPGIPVYQGPYKTLVLAITIFWCVAYSVGFDGGLKRVFSWAPLRYLGNMSYSYYLIHGVTLQGVALLWILLASTGVRGSILFVAALPAGLAATWVTATILFVTIEKPCSLRSQQARAPSARHGRQPRAMGADGLASPS